MFHVNPLPDSHKISSLLFSEKYEKLFMDVVCCVVVTGGLRDKSQNWCMFETKLKLHES